MARVSEKAKANGRAYSRAYYNRNKGTDRERSALEKFLYHYFWRRSRSERDAIYWIYDQKIPDPQGKYRCARCKENKAPTEFRQLRFATRGRRFDYHCIKCRHDANAMLPVALARARYIKSKYGLEWDAYLELFVSQDRKCAICRNAIFIVDSSRKRNSAHVDHCHENGKVRGLLCNHCNTGLGSFFENKQTLMNAIKYLSNTPEVPPAF